MRNYDEFVKEAFEKEAILDELGKGMNHKVRAAKYNALADMRKNKLDVGAKMYRNSWDLGGGTDAGSLAVKSHADKLMKRQTKGILRAEHKVNALNSMGVKGDIARKLSPDRYKDMMGNAVWQSKITNPLSESPRLGAGKNGIIG